MTMNEWVCEWVSGWVNEWLRPRAMGECVVWKMQKSNTKYKYITNKRDSETDRRRDRQTDRQANDESRNRPDNPIAIAIHFTIVHCLTYFTVPRTLGGTIQVKWLIAGHSGSGVVGRGTVAQWFNDLKIAVWQFIINESILFSFYWDFFLIFCFILWCFYVLRYFIPCSYLMSWSILCFNA